MLKAWLYLSSYHLPRGSTTPPLILGNFISLSFSLPHPLVSKPLPIQEDVTDSHSQPCQSVLPCKREAEGTGTRLG